MEHYVSSGSAKIWTFIHDDQNKSKPYLLMCGGGPGINDGLLGCDPLLNHRFNTIRFNQRGCGSSTADEKYDVETTIDDIEQIRQNYSIQKWYIIGHSWGANIALFYALKYPQYCKGIIYLCGIGIQNDDDWNKEFKQNAEVMTPLLEMEVSLLKDFEVNYDVLNYALRSFNKYIKSPMLLKKISKLQTPTLVLCGEKDIRPNWPAIQLSNLLPAATLSMIDGCGHLPWATHPETLSKTIFDWIDKNIK